MDLNQVWNNLLVISIILQEKNKYIFPNYIIELTKFCCYIGVARKNRSGHV